jgi:hypothetical protein
MKNCLNCLHYLDQQSNIRMLNEIETILRPIIKTRFQDLSDQQEQKMEAKSQNILVAIRWQKHKVLPSGGFSSQKKKLHWCYVTRVLHIPSRISTGCLSGTGTRWVGTVRVRTGYATADTVSGTAGYGWVRYPVRLGAVPVRLDAVKHKKFKKSSAWVRFEPKK